MRIVHPNLAYVKHILIVDDSTLIRRSLRVLLEECPDWVVCGEAENGSDGIEKAQQLHPDLIVMDLVMPVLNGIEATRLLKRLLPTTPIVMFTTFADPHINKKTALTAGVHAVIDKSESSTLIGSIQQLLVSGLPPPYAA